MRSAFSLIELLMTIVIISIAFIGIPLIMENSARTISWLQNSKAIYHGLAKIQIVRGKYWDENNHTNVLNTTELPCPRNGHYVAEGRRRCATVFPSADTSFGEGKDATDWNDIDDFDGEEDIGVEGLYAIKTRVKYIDYPVYVDNNLSMKDTTRDQTNIKEIEVKVTKQGSSVSTYRYYAGNIGTSKPFIKDNP